MVMQLHCFGESGNAYKAALTLSLCGLGWAPVFVDFFNGATRSPEYRALNVMGEVPVLVDGGLVLSQSGAIQYHAVERSGKLGGRGPEEAREVLRWVLFDNHKVSGQAGTLRFNMNFLPEARRDAAVNAFLSARLRSALAVLERHLGHRDWIVGDGPTIADTACCGYLYYPEPFGFDRGAMPNIDRWLANISGLPGWKHPYDMMPGNPGDRARGGP